MFHHPRFSTIKDRSPITYYTEAIWNALYEYGADLVLNGHDHAYQRFARSAPTARATVLRSAFGRIAVGTGGGEGFYSFSDTLPPASNLEVRDNHTLGVLKVTLHAGSYDWRFIPTGGGNIHRFRFWNLSRETDVMSRLKLLVLLGVVAVACKPAVGPVSPPPPATTPT